MPASSQTDDIEEITVTAQKREENIQDVPFSITAFSPDDIRDLGVNQPRDLAQITPGLVMNVSANAETDPLFTLRGIGMNDVQSNQNPAITPYIDDVALPSPVMAGFQIFDLERIEVLKGPQGTLYGRNTTGGAIRFVSRRPTQELDASARVDVAEYEQMAFEGAIGGGLGETFAGRVAVRRTIQNEGWQTLVLPDTEGVAFGPGVDSDNGEIDRNAIRTSLLWTPTDTFDALVIADFGKEDSESMAFEHAGNLLQDGSGLCSFATTGVRDETQCASFGQVRDEPAGTPLTPETEVYSDTNGPRSVGSNFGQGNDIDGESWGVATTLNVNLDRFSITSVTGYREFDRRLAQDQGASPFHIHDIDNLEDIESFTQEIRVSSNETWEGILWQAGLYFGDDDIRSSNTTDFRDHTSFTNFISQGFRQQTDNFAVFSQVEWTLNDRWSLLGGLRWTTEDRSFHYGGSAVGVGPSPVADFSDEISSDDFSGKIGVNYQPVETLLVYGSFSRGFKAGGFPASIAFSEPQFFPFEPEQLNAYEIGFKSTLAGGVLRLNSAAYYYDWQDFQAQTAVDREGIRLIVLSNAGDAEILGLESVIDWLPTDNLTLSLGFNWMDAEIVSGDYDGDTPAHTPEYMLNGILRYDFPAWSAGYEPFAQIDFSYQDDVQFILANHPGAAEDAYTLLNLRAGLRSMDGRWEVAAWARNATDELYRTEVFGPGSGFLPGRIHYGPPRIVGLTVTWSY
jgi:iron complex outermembrane recepter protein